MDNRTKELGIRIFVRDYLETADVRHHTPAVILQNEQFKEVLGNALAVFVRSLEREPAAEPVAWMTEESGVIATAKERRAMGKFWKEVYTIPLYATPPIEPSGKPVDIEAVMGVVKEWEEYDTRVDHGSAGENEYLDIAGFYLFWSDLKARLTTLFNPQP